MEPGTSNLGPSGFWYSVVLTVGVCWSVNALGGNLNGPLMIAGPLVLCAVVAILGVGRISLHALGVMLNLFATFCVGVGFGYVLKMTGVIEFVRDRLRTLGITV